MYRLDALTRRDILVTLHPRHPTQKVRELIFWIMLCRSLYLYCAAGFRLLFQPYRYLPSAVACVTRCTLSHVDNFPRPSFFH